MSLVQCEMVIKVSQGGTEIWRGSGFEGFKRRHLLMNCERGWQARSGESEQGKPDQTSSQANTNSHSDTNRRGQEAARKNFTTHYSSGN